MIWIQLIFFSIASEWLGKNITRPVVVIFNQNKTIEIKSQKGNTLRIFDLSYRNCELSIYLITNDCYVLLKNRNHYDLVKQIYQVNRTLYFTYYFRC